MKVRTDPKISSRPALSEVHFYPDSHVDAAFTECASSPRLANSQDRADLTSQGAQVTKKPNNDPVGDAIPLALKPHINGWPEFGDMTVRSRKGVVQSLWFRGFFSALLLALGTSMSLASTSPNQKTQMQTPARFNLAIVGYNYTSRYIDDFSVDGQGGGNLYVSGPTSGGGGAVCCVSYIQGAAAGEVIVRWQSGGCMFRVPGGLADGRTHLAHSFYRELKVRVDPRIPDHPENFEVHFYPDGHVEAAISASESSPRMVYSKTRADRSDFPRCPGDKEPKQ